MSPSSRLKLKCKRFFDLTEYVLVRAAAVLGWLLYIRFVLFGNPPGCFR
jgi:hypothetical protein